MSEGDRVCFALTLSSPVEGRVLFYSLPMITYYLTAGSSAAMSPAILPWVKACSVILPV